MVAVGAKPVTARSAVAEARMRLPRAVAMALRKSGHRTKKGPVFDTAIIAGVMAAKRTHELIPFCHPLALEDCRIDVATVRGGLVIRCRVSVHHRTGVEMEALTGATVAALTVYDIAHRIGVHFGKEPRLVYLHAGTRIGARALKIGGDSFDPGILPRAFSRLAPFEIEDCLCIYKDELCIGTRSRSARRKSKCAVTVRQACAWE